MRLVTYDAGSGPRVGALEEDDRVVDLGFDGDMVAFIAAGAPVRRRSFVDGRARLLAPLRPHTLRDFMAFEGHFRTALSKLGRDVPAEWYDVPAYYKGMPDTVIGPDQQIPWPSFADHLDHELELAAIIGTQVCDPSQDQAAQAIFGYTIYNDISARDVQSRELPIGMGPGKAKDWDGSNVLGPCIVTADSFDLGSAPMHVRVNGELWGTDTAASMHHSFAAMICYAADSQTVRPGEVFGSGTAAGGSGIELDRFLAPGDLVELEVEGIGVLRNRIGPKGG
jgi:2-keto-4-pentenoate hydratase/2-oxohepta-3-ene-1,7-dioic acid hydratase in catechol pathway